MTTDATPSSLPTLHGRCCTLRLPHPGDEADRLAIGRHADFVHMSGGSTRDLAPLTAADARAWYEKLARERFAWVIEVAGRGVGTARLSHIDEVNRAASFSIGIFDPALWNRGIGTEATRLVLDFAFGELDLYRVELEVFDFNVRAQKSYAKSGFTVEGVKRGGLLWDGVRHDVIMMAALRNT